tara:strand:- start:264 stop:464 length:201 start_codon:yes stop_codon:yes gene_type:complete
LYAILKNFFHGHYRENCPEKRRLSESVGCDGILAESLDLATENILSGFSKNRPTLIIIREGEKWLN